MKLSEAERGTYLKLDDLVFFALGKNQFILALAGDTMRQGEAPYDMDLPVITREEYLSVVRLASHGNDWHSITLSQAVQHGIEQNVFQC